ncbi:hypothetical protein OOK31_00095 [Streptomyces sp. NBC_00249]|uniref:hypothetical protein n=1 Tax=Streptomyces sp. NBC_00249 TaxID=2975690 RepID=UPI00224CB304|nr:hypothetical protein [Streptomyces sp. NBC_00249]MCX5192307.1 hypothetical protein [Streptomyces sp. NBC_00249]
MGHTMVIAVSPSDLDRLDALVQEHQTAETKWQADAEQTAGVLNLRGPGLRTARARIRAERDRLRESGRHRVTRRRALTPALHTELEQRGLLQQWEPVPEGAQQAGQMLGGTGPHAGAGLTGRLCVALPDAIWMPLHRGLYWTNLPHLEALQAWTDQWGRGRAAGRAAVPQEVLDERARHAAHVTTTGTVLRAALDRIIKSRHEGA